MKSFLKRILRILYSIQKKVWIRISILIVKSIKPNLFLAYNAEKVRDGAGAQFHRILSISLVSFLFNLRMVRPHIEDITIHPLDPIQDPINLQGYLNEWNSRVFSSKEYVYRASEERNCKNVYFDSLTLSRLVYISIKSFLLKQPTIIYVNDSHAISDYCVEKYRLAIQFFFTEFLEFLNVQNHRSELIVHYRQGSGGFAIHPGQSIPRQMSINSVISAVEDIASSKIHRISVLRLFTDSPQNSFIFSPIQSQIHLWQNMPGFDGKSVVNESSGVENYLSPAAEKRNLIFVVDRDVDAFQMIVAMARAEALIISRSSLSYVGALFNQDGEVFYPNGFWHTKLKRWRTYN